jgi:hypothetical protein
MNTQEKAKEEKGGRSEGKRLREGKRKGRAIGLEAGWKKKAPGRGSQTEKGRIGVYRGCRRPSEGGRVGGR